VLHLYALVPAATEPPLDAEGLEGAPLRRLAEGPLAAIVSEHEARARPSEAAILRHAHVVEHVAAGVDALLPARFGDCFRDEEAVRSRLRERSDELLATLEAVRGCVEVGLRVAVRERGRGRSDAGAGPARPATGRDYMRALQERAAEESRRVGAIHEPLGRLARRSVVRRGGDGAPVLLTAAYLVRADGVERVREEVARLQAEHRELALVCTGPWPPYSFAEPETGAA
jgi:hypothetical protein